MKVCWLIRGGLLRYSIQLLEASAREAWYLLTPYTSEYGPDFFGAEKGTIVSEQSCSGGKMVHREQSSAALPRPIDFCKPDELLIGAGHDNLKVNCMIDILIITDE